MRPATPSEAPCLAPFPGTRELHNQIGPIASCYQPGIELTQSGLQICGPQNRWKIEKAVEAERLCVLPPLEREARCARRGSEPDSARLKEGAIGSADGYVLGVTTSEIRSSRQLKQPPRSQGKPTVADIVVVGKLRPRCPDIVEAQESIRPAAAIQNEPVPLDDEDMRQVDVLGEPSKNEIGIFLAVLDRLDPGPLDGRVRVRRRFSIRQQLDAPEYHLVDRAPKRGDSLRDRDACDGAESNLRQGNSTQVSLIPVSVPSSVAAPIM